MCLLPLPRATETEGENRVLRRMFGPKRNEEAGGWRKLHNEELHNLYSSPSIIKSVMKDEMGGACSKNGEKKNAFRILVGKPDGNKPLGRPRRRWVDNVKMDLKQIRWDGVDWIDMAQDRDQLRALVNMVLNLRVP
jgi:hypothetical protein